MSRRLPISSRRLASRGSIPFVGAIRAKTRSSPMLSIGLLVGGAMLLIIFSSQGSGTSNIHRDAISKLGGGAPCAAEVIKALPILDEVYGNSMHRVLYVGPDTCSVIREILKEEDTQAWGVEPHYLEDASANCKTLVRKGIVRVADIKYPLPYQEYAFSLVLVSDVPDHLSPRYLNKTLPEMARLAIDGVVLFTGMPGQRKTKVAEPSRFGRPAKWRSNSWWTKYFIQIGLGEKKEETTRFKEASAKHWYKPGCQVFHLNRFP